MITVGIVSSGKKAPHLIQQDLINEREDVDTNSEAIPEVNDIRSIYGLNNEWNYDNMLIELYHESLEKDHRYSNLDDGFILYKDDYMSLKFQFIGKRCRILKSVLDSYSSGIIVDYRCISTISAKLANAYIRYFTKRASKLDIIRLNEHFYHHAYYGSVFKHTFGTEKVYRNKHLINV